ncbi:MAG: GDSL-type esterase/lipase family protein, partial [Thermodesulfobacteriota bacterium]|nr:GDSL-type esterase/lipase family protein [Thermodesulfobacteriota bacterium]
MITSEFAIRLIFKNITTTADNRSYFAKKWKRKNVRLNSWGFREIEFDLAKPAGMYRIAVVGDSITFGQGIPENSRFSNLLESYLTNKGHYQILNCGKCGGETIHHLKSLQDVVLKAEPDFVVLQWFPNDFEGRDKTGRPKYLSLLPSNTICSMLTPTSALYYVLSHQWRALQIRFGYCDSYASYMDKRFSNPQNCDSIEAMAALTEFIEQCHNRDIGVGFFLFPATNVDLGDSYPFVYLHERVRELCDKKKITCLDLRSTFARDSVRTK